MTLGKRLQEFRDCKGYSRDSVASLTGFSRASIESWELNQRRPSLAKATKLATLYGTTVNDLIGDTLLNEGQRIKLSEVSAIILSNDEEKKEQIRTKLRSAQYDETKIQFFFDMTMALAKP